MTFLSAFTSIAVLCLVTVHNVECSLNLNFDGSTNSALFLDVGHLNHSKEFLLNAQSNVRFFAVLEPSKPVSLKSQFGPISVRETIYPNTIQDALGLFSSRDSQQHKTSHLGQDDTILPANTADLTAHLVSSIVYSNSPQLRILFQSNAASTSQTIGDLDQIDHLDHLEKTTDSTIAPAANGTVEHHLCAVAIVKFNSIQESEASKTANDAQFKPLVASCTLNKEGVCISQVTIPADWWPAVILDAVASSNNADQSKQTKQQQNKPVSAEVLFTAVYSEKCGSEHGQQPASTDQQSKTKSNKSAESDDAMTNFNWQQDNFHLENAGKVTLKPFDGTYEELTNDDIIRILIPQKPVHAKTRLHIPVCYRYHRNYPLFAFSLRVRVKPGMRVVGAKLARKIQSNPQPLTNSAKSSKRKQNRLLNEYNKLNTAQNWEISVQSNSKQTQATITAFLKLNSKDQLVNEEKQIKSESGDDNDEDEDLDDDLEEFDEDLMNLMPSTCNEVYTILLEVDEKAAEYSDAGRIVWQLLYLTDLENSNQEEGNARKHHLKRDFDRESSKLTCKLDIQKDEIESVIALTKNRNLLNTAILTGKQNMQSLKVYVVSSAGRFGDVTLQASCSSTDETVLKVSPSCTALYLDGSETKSSINATILIHYGVYTGIASFQVWMPKLPLEIDVSDDQLSAVHSWKIPHLKQSNGNHHGSSSSGHYGHRARKLLTQHSHHSSHHGNQNKHHSHHKHENNNHQDGSQTAEMGCRLRYQQAYIEAYAKFFIVDENSGREWSFINRKYSFRVTDLILPHLHLSENRLAIIRSNTIEGLNPGTVELKILSPITGKQLASKKIRITSDQETITNLQVRLLTGLQMQIKPEQTVLDHSVSGPLSNSQLTVWSVRTSENSALTTQYQEGLLDIEIKFSDGKVISLSDITDSDYHLQIDSGNSSMVAYAPGMTASLPRIIALKSGHNIKLNVSLQAPVQCSKKNTLPLQQQIVYLNVNLNQPKVKSTNSQQSHSETAKPTSPVNHDASSKHQISVEHLDSSDSNANLQNDGHDTMLPTAQVQRFHSLYNSQLSVSQLNKLVRPINESKSSNSWTGVEIGVYAVLCALGLIMTAFMTGCFVFAIKQKNSNNSTEFTTVTTVKNDGDHEGFNGGGADFLNNNASRLNKMIGDQWSWLQQQANHKFNRSPEDDDNQISYDANGNPIIQSKVNIRSNPFDDEQNENQDANDKIEINKNRQSIISYPGSEISIQITANPIVNAIESTLSNVLKRGDDKNRKAVEEVKTPEPDLQEIKNMLTYCKTIQPAPLATQNQANTKTAHKQPPPIPPRRAQQQMNGGATFVRGKRTPNQQLPAHIPGIACRTLNASNLSNSSSASSNNSVNNSPTNSSSSSKSISPSLSLSSSDSGIQNELRIDEQSPNDDEKHFCITNPFLNEDAEQQMVNQESKPPVDAIQLTKTRSFARQPPAYRSEAEDDLNKVSSENVYINTTGPAVPKHNEANRQRTRIIPPRSLFEEMNYNEIVNYIENMEESTA